MNIRTLRRSIDQIDSQMLRLLNRRMRVARRIGKLKRQLGNHWVDPQRERAILERLSRRNHGPLTTAGLHAVYRRIFVNTRAVQRPIARRRPR